MGWDGLCFSSSVLYACRSDRLLGSESVVCVERLWDAAVCEGGEDRHGHWLGRIRGLSFSPRSCWCFTMKPTGEPKSLCNSCHSASCKVFHDFVHFIKKKKRKKQLFLQTVCLSGWLFFISRLHLLAWPLGE